MKKNVVTIILAAFALGVALHQLPGRAATLNVVDFGARGDAIQTLASTISNSTLVVLVPTNRLSAADVGRLIELFGIGPATSPTNNQDLIATIVSVHSSTRVTISKPACVTATGVHCTYGTQNAAAFQNCVNACQGSNNVVIIPSGTYLIVPPQIFSTNNYGSLRMPPAITLNKGGIKFVGNTPNNTVLLGNGAWILNNGTVQRGMLFGCMGPVTNNYPLIFQNLSFNGGVQAGNLGYGNGPADPATGGGWDVTHDAVVDLGKPPYHTNKFFVNCSFEHWRGEMVKSVVNWTAGFIAMTNCAFYDGDGSGFNFNWTPHVINGCLFSNLSMAIEFYVGTMQTNCIFENCVITNTRIAITLVGALSNYPPPIYYIVSNTISASKYDICLGPVRNVQITGNTFLGGGIGVATDGYSYQGTDFNGNITVENNQFNRTIYPVGICGGGEDRLVDMTVKNNTAWGCKSFASGYGWSSNIVFLENSSFQPSGPGGLDSTALAGQWFIDQMSNNFPMNVLYIGKNNPTNTLSYATGMLQELEGSNPNGVVFLDDGSPQHIPSEAELVITNASPYAVTICHSSTQPLASPITLPTGTCFTYAWSNGMWNLATGLLPPSGLHIVNR